MTLHDDEIALPVRRGDAEMTWVVRFRYHKGEPMGWETPGAPESIEILHAYDWHSGKAVTLTYAEESQATKLAWEKVKQ